MILPVTKDKAMAAQKFHTNRCAITIGPRGGKIITCEVYRRNGQTKTWKTRPDDFQVPVKYGMYEYGYVDNGNAHLVHVADDCPIKEETQWR